MYELLRRRATKLQYGLKMFPCEHPPFKAVAQFRISGFSEPMLAGRNMPLHTSILDTVEFVAFIKLLARRVVESDDDAADPCLFEVDRERLAVGVHWPARMCVFVRLAFRVTNWLCRPRGETEYHTDGKNCKERTHWIFLHTTVLLFVRANLQTYIDLQLKHSRKIIRETVEFPPSRRTSKGLVAPAGANLARVNRTSSSPFHNTAVLIGCAGRMLNPSASISECYFRLAPIILRRTIVARRERCLGAAFGPHRARCQHAKCWQQKKPLF